MNMRNKAAISHLLQTVWLGCAILLSIGLLGCAGSGTFFQRSNDVAIEFQKGIILEDHRYYAGGPEAKPNALAAIHTDYTLESEHWREIGDLTPENLAKLVERVRFVTGAEYKEKNFTNGARLVGPDGRAIGVWYSVTAYSQVQYLGDNRIYLSFPPAYLPSNVRIPLWDGGFERPH